MLAAYGWGPGADRVSSTAPVYSDESEWPDCIESHRHTGSGNRSAFLVGLLRTGQSANGPASAARRRMFVIRFGPVAYVMELAGRSIVVAFMIGRLSCVSDVRAAARCAMADAVAGFRSAGPVIVVSHFDADGLSAAAILVRALRAAGRPVQPLVVGKVESPWDAAVRQRIAALDPAGLVIADLGTRPDVVLPGCPTLVIDHHVPTGEPASAVTISGNGLDPEPTTALLAWWAASALGDQADLLWLAAIGLIGDMAEERGFPELETAQARWGKTALRDATSLVNAPRRTAAADAGPALRLLLRADGPKMITVDLR